MLGVCVDVGLDEGVSVSLWDAEPEAVLLGVRVDVWLDVRVSVSV